MSIPITRRQAIGSTAALVVSAGAPTGLLAGGRSGKFPKKFLWGAATSGHQTEGNNVSSDFWAMEQAVPNVFAEPSGDALDGFSRWASDLDLVRSLGLNSYRFSLEWARIEPEEGRFSQVMLDHYRRIIDGCIARGLAPVVTFNHFSCPRWFAALGGWTNPKAPDLFARYCGRAARDLAAGVHYAVTLNEPNLPTILSWIGLPSSLYEAHAANLRAAGKLSGTDRFSAGFLLSRDEHRIMIPHMGEAHRRGRAAIKSVRPDLPVGLSLAVSDDQAVGSTVKRDEKRSEAYLPWFEFARDDEFIGVQNYDRTRLDDNGPMPPPADSVRSAMGAEIYAPSLGGAAAYVYKATGKPVLITEHGVGIDDDQIRAKFIPEALAGLHAEMERGTKVLGYLHWSLLDNFEWYFGFGPKFGLVAVDRKTFARKVKPSALIFAKIAKNNALQGS